MPIPKKPTMVYRKLGKTNIDISLLSFGTMRWASEESCYETVQRGLDAGMNYLDCSTGYVGGMSEVWSGRAVKARRSEAYVSSKTMYGSAPTESALRRAIENSLRRAELDYFDFYQLWGLSSMDMLRDALKKGGFVSGVRKAMEDGLIREGLGFTFHGSPEVFRAAVDTGEFMAATVSYNLMKRTEEENIRYAADKGVGIFVMNPLGGGVLAMAGDRQMSFLSDEGDGPWMGALRFLFANSGITAALVGVSAPGHITRDLQALGGESLTESWRQGMAQTMDAVELTDPGFCTGCKYCEVCAKGFGPSKLMQALRNAKRYKVADADLKQWIQSAYVHDTAPEVQLTNCIECGLCEKKCPQHLAITEEIRRVKGLFL